MVPLTAASHVTVCATVIDAAEAVTVTEVIRGFDPPVKPAPPLLPQLEQANANVERRSSRERCDERKVDIIPTVS